MQQKTFNKICNTSCLIYSQANGLPLKQVANKLKVRGKHLQKIITVGFSAYDSCVHSCSVWYAYQFKSAI